jgi:hypothetical protein
MRHEPIEDLYFDWLCAKVRLDDTVTYLELLRILHSYEFIPIHKGDENRCADALELRDLFIDETGVEVDFEWLESGCSVLEILVKFSELAAFQIDMTPREWFWQFITNLKLDGYRRATRQDHDEINEILDRFVMRTYDDSGDGGLFPLRRPKNDQRGVELWYQFCEYVDDHGLLYDLLG